jgi:hypothetical protein
MVLGVVVLCGLWRQCVMEHYGWVQHLSRDLLRQR